MAIDITLGLVIGIVTAAAGGYLMYRGRRKIGLPTLLTGVAIVASGVMGIPLLILLVPLVIVGLVIK